MPESQQINLNWTKMCYEFWALEDKDALFVRSKILAHKQANAWSLSTALSAHSHPLGFFLCSAPGLGLTRRALFLATATSPTTADSAASVVLEHRPLRPWYRICELKTMFIITLRCCQPFPQSRHVQWWCKCNGGWMKLLLPQHDQGSDPKLYQQSLCSSQLCTLC